MCQSSAMSSTHPNSANLQAIRDRAQQLLLMKSPPVMPPAGIPKFPSPSGAVASSAVSTGLVPPPPPKTATKPGHGHAPPVALACAAAMKQEIPAACKTAIAKCPPKASETSVPLASTDIPNKKAKMSAPAPPSTAAIDNPAPPSKAAMDNPAPPSKAAMDNPAPPSKAAMDKPALSSKAAMPDKTLIEHDQKKLMESIGQVYVQGSEAGLGFPRTIALCTR